MIANPRQQHRIVTGCCHAEFASHRAMHAPTPQPFRVMLVMDAARIAEMNGLLFGDPLNTFRVVVQFGNKRGFVQRRSVPVGMKLQVESGSRQFARLRNS